MSPRWKAFIFAAALLSACAAPIERGPEFSHYLENPTPFRLLEVLSGKSNPERRAILVQALEAAGLPYRIESFSNGGYLGDNVVAELGVGGPTLVLAAHYDRVPQAPGANDNASCVAALIAAYARLRKAAPPAHVKVRFLFSDGEEAGLQGAKAYLDAHGADDVLGVASFELCGIGNAFGIWDVHGPAEGALIVRALVAAGEAENVYSAIHGYVPRFSSDHRVFADAGLPAVGVTVLPKPDEAVLREYVDNPNSFKWIFRFLRPTIFQTYHVPEDRPDTVQAEALEMTARIIFQTVKAFDRLAGERG